MEKEKGHSDTSRTPPYLKKRATLIHPPQSHFLKRKRRLEICYFKTAVRLLYFVLAHEYPAAETTVFLLSRWAGKGYNIKKAEPINHISKRVIGSASLRLAL